MDILDVLNDVGRLYSELSGSSCPINLNRRHCESKNKVYLDILYAILEFTIDGYKF